MAEREVIERGVGAEEVVERDAGARAGRGEGEVAADEEEQRADGDEAVKGGAKRAAVRVGEEGEVAR